MISLCGLKPFRQGNQGLGPGPGDAPGRPCLQRSGFVPAGSVLGVALQFPLVGRPALPGASHWGPTRDLHHGEPVLQRRRHVSASRTRWLSPRSSRSAAGSIPYCAASTPLIHPGALPPAGGLISSAGSPAPASNHESPSSSSTCRLPRAHLGPRHEREHARLERGGDELDPRPRVTR